MANHNETQRMGQEGSEMGPEVQMEETDMPVDYDQVVDGTLEIHQGVTCEINRVERMKFDNLASLTGPDPKKL